MHVVGKSMNDIYRQLCGKISVQGHEATGTREMLNSGFTLLDITDNIATARTGYSLSHMLGGLASCLTGRDGGGLDRAARVVDTLRRDPHSRRAVIGFDVPGAGRPETGDGIRAIALVFELREGRLDCTGIMCSDDVWLGTPYDVVLFTEMQKHIANELGVAYGKYTHFAVSLYACAEDIDRVREVWCRKHEAPRLKLDIEKFSAHIPEIERIAMSSDAPGPAVSEYCLDKAIVTEVDDED